MKKYWVRCIIVILLSVVGIKMRSLFIPPFVFDTALATLPFFEVGSLWKKLPHQNITLVTAMFFVMWIIIFGVIEWRTGTCLGLAAHCYPMYPLCYVAAAAGTSMVSGLSELLTRLPEKLWRPIAYLGRYSLYMVCIHSVDFYWESVWGITDINLFDIILRCATDIVIFALFIVLRRAKRNVLYEK